MSKDVDPDAFQLTLNSPPAFSQSDDPDASARWSILDSVGQQLDSLQGTASSPPGRAPKRVGQQIILENSYSPAKPDQNQIRKSDAEPGAARTPSSASARVPGAREAEAKTPPLILRFSAAKQSVTDQPGSTPLKDLLRRITQ